MIKAAKVIDVLNKQILRLEKFKDEDVSAFVLIIPPEGEAINFVTMDEHSDPATFFQTLAARCKLTMESTQMGGVSVPGYPRR